MKSYKNGSYMVTFNISSIMKAVLFLLLALLLLFSLSGILTSIKPGYRVNSNIVNQTTKNLSSKLLYQFFASENQVLNAKVKENEKLPSFSSIMMSMGTNISFKDPRSFLGRELPGFTVFDSEILVAGEGTNYTNLPIESMPSDAIFNSKKEANLKNTDEIDKNNQGSNSTEQSSTPPVSTNGHKKVYIYFTHTRESFLPYLDGVTDPDAAQHSKLNVTKVGEKLKEELENRGIGTSIDKTDVQNLLLKKGEKYPQSYMESRTLVQTAMTSNHDLSYFIDIHRDSRRKKDTTITINGKSYAKIAFVIGGNNPNYEKNAQLASELDKQLKKKYKGLSRGVIKKSGAYTNGKFNQDLSKNAFLIEVGGVDNTFEEMYRTVTALADVFSDYYWQAEKVEGNTSEPASKK